MTKINSISIHGFKSFAHKTEIPFNDKFNVILGPNGSGKSNVGDALCFVLGRLSAKSMRAEKAANLIFNGGKSKHPATTAVVELAFDNSTKIFPEQAGEVVINRTITKDGSSTYRINGKKRTRTEVLDLLAAARINPEGYNIILQGYINHFVEMHPQERRRIIEEISDVTVYEEKKHKALLELQKVEEQLNNAEIILKERGVYLKELKKDRDQALQFKELKDKIDTNKATFLQLQLQEREQQKAKYDADIEKLQGKLHQAEEETGKLKKKIEEHQQRISQLNREIEEKGEKEQVAVHHGIEDFKVSLAQDRTRLSTVKDEISKLQQRKDQFRQEIKELEEKSTASQEHYQELQELRAKKKKELQELEQSLAQFKKKNNLEISQELERDLEEKDKLIEQQQEEVQRLRAQQQELLRDKDKLEYQLQSLDERIKKVKEVEKQHSQQIKELQQKKQEFRAATLKLNQCLDQDSNYASQLGNARKKRAELQEKQAQLNATALSLQANLTSNQAIKAILDDRRKFKGVYGTIAGLGQVNKKYAAAVEAAAGQKMQFIVVDNDAVAAECITFLKKGKLGAASFIPLNKIKAKEIAPEDRKLLKGQGVHDFAFNLVSFKPQFKKAFEYVFGNTLVVENIDTSRSVGIGRVKMATLDGDLAEASGVMKGGFRARKTTLGFAEKDSLEELEHTEKELAELEKVLHSLLQKREGNEQEMATLRRLRGELEGQIITMEKTLHLEDTDLNATTELQQELSSQLQGVNTQLTTLQREITSLNTGLAELKSKKQLLRSQVSELRNPRLLAQLRAYEESKAKGREELVALEAEMKGAVQQREQMYAPELEKIREIIKQHDKEEAQFSAEVKTLQARVQQAEKGLSQREKESKDFYSKYRELFNQREKLRTEITKADAAMENTRDKMREHEREKNLVSLKNAEIKGKLAALQEEFKRFKGAEIIKGKSAEELQSEIRKFESLLTQMSAVNMKALEVYEQVEKEFNVLLEKKAGLGKEKTDVLTLMNEIETKKKDHFMKTFNLVGDNFQRIFGSLFKKGRAYLQLDNPANPFDEGLSIKVKVTGNRFMDIKSLSGGEKTLTALSFIFAIQEHQPSSFYVLDEVDASLDKQNSELLARLIRTYAEGAQYILISHNDALISEADTLYGVSMNDGVSKVTSLRI